MPCLLEDPRRGGEGRRGEELELSCSCCRNSSATPCLPCLRFSSVSSASSTSVWLADWEWVPPQPLHHLERWGGRGEGERENAMRIYVLFEVHKHKCMSTKILQLKHLQMKLHHMLGLLEAEKSEKSAMRNI